MPMKNSIKLLLFFCLFNAKSLSSQNSDLYVIKFKTGLQIKCELVKVVPDSFVMVRQYGLLTKIPMNDILDINYSESIAGAGSFGGGRGKTKALRRPLPDTGWSVGIQPGFTIGSAPGWGATSSFVFRGSLLKSDGKRWMYGFNAGFDPYDYYGEVIGATMLEGRYLLTKNDTKPVFLVANLGYGFNLSSPRTGGDGGFGCSIGMGKSYRLKNQNSFSYMFTYKIQQFESESWSWWIRSNQMQMIDTRRFEFRVEWRY
jgi:hypothetical protein